MKAENLAALIAASSGIVVAVLAWIERGRVTRRQAVASAEESAFASWKALAEEYRQKLKENEELYQELVFKYVGLQAIVTDLKIEVERRKITEQEHITRITELKSMIEALLKEKKPNG